MSSKRPCVSEQSSALGPPFRVSGGWVTTCSGRVQRSPNDMPEVLARMVRGGGRTLLPHRSRGAVLFGRCTYLNNEDYRPIGSGLSVASRVSGRAGVSPAGGEAVMGAGVARRAVGRKRLAIFVEWTHDLATPSKWRVSRSTLQFIAAEARAP